MRLRIVQIMCAIFATALLVSCGAGQPVGETAQVESPRQVVFSVANKDRSAPVTMMKVVVNGQPLIYGALQATASGEYLYVSTKISAVKMEIRVLSETEEGPTLEAEKTMLVEDRLWVVITRLRDIDGDPELVIEASYEKPLPMGEE